MIVMVKECGNCPGSDLIKYGKNRVGTPRYRCKDANKKGFTLAHKPLTINVEDNGFEPMTSCMPCKRSTS